MSPDVLNCCFEVVGALLTGLSVRRIFLDRRVAGVSVWPVLFFTSWGLWNLFYYGHLDQPWSRAGAGLLCAANVAWLVGLVKYGRSR